MSKTARQLSLRLNHERAELLARFEAKTGVDGTTLCYNALDAALAHWQKHGNFTFPFTLVPSESLTTNARSGEK